MGAVKKKYSPSLGREVLFPTPEARERHALLLLYHRCNGAKWPSYANTNWCDKDKPLSEWEGVKVEDGRVVRLDVCGCGDAFGGAFPLELGWLTQLQALNFRGNN